MLLPTISHEIGHYLAMTGGRDGLDPDWPCILGAASADRYPAPVLIVSGPSYPGPLGASVLRCGPMGQLDALISGELLTWSDGAVTPLSQGARAPIDAYVRRRAATRVSRANSVRDGALASAFQTALDQSASIKAVGAGVGLSPVETLGDGAPLIAQVLGAGLSRCVIIGGPPTFIREWDTHNNNFSLQSMLWEDLFAGLIALQEALESTPGTMGETLADETVIVLLSEMGRTPYLNAFAGKDHWPYTSVMLVGSGVAGDRVIGGHDDSWGGLSVDLATGDVTSDGTTLSGGAVGGALLMLGDVDPGEWVDDAEPLAAVVG